MNNDATQSSASNPPSGSYRVRWRGKITEEMTVSLILKKIESGELGMLSQIEVNDRWLTIRDFLAGHEQSEKERIATANRAAEAERARRKEEAVQDAVEKNRLAEEIAAERSRQHELETERARAQPATQQGNASLSDMLNHPIIIIISSIIFVLSVGFLIKQRLDGRVDHKKVEDTLKMIYGDKYTPP